MFVIFNWLHKEQTRSCWRVWRRVWPCCYVYAWQDYDNISGWCWWEDGAQSCLAAHRALAVVFWTRVVRHETALWLSTSLIFILWLTARVHNIILACWGHAMPQCRDRLWSTVNQPVITIRLEVVTADVEEFLVVVRKRTPSVLSDRTRSPSVTKTKAGQFRF